MGIYKKDKSLSQVGQFTAQIQTLDIPGEIKIGYSPIGFVRCGRSACRAMKFNFKVGKETGGKKMESPHSLKSNEMAEVVFRPQQPLVVDSFKNCEGLSRIAFLDGNTAVCLSRSPRWWPRPTCPLRRRARRRSKLFALCFGRGIRCAAPDLPTSCDTSLGCERSGNLMAARRRCGCGVGWQRPPKRSLTFV